MSEAIALDDEFDETLGFRINRRPYDPEQTRHRLRDLARFVSDAQELVVADGAEVFFSDTAAGRRNRLAAERLVEKFAEATAKLHSDFKLQHLDVPWREIYGARTVVVHHYDQTDDDLLWEMITAHLPDVLDRLDAGR